MVRTCNEHRIPLTARGLGTGTTGATVPEPGGVVLSFERMNRILAIDPANRLAIVEPGVVNEDLQRAAAEHGFFWPPDPTSAAVPAPRPSSTARRARTRSGCPPSSAPASRSAPAS